MRTFIKFAGAISFILVMVACNQTGSEVEEEEMATGNPTPEEIFESNSDADIFLMHQIVYKNAEDIEWVQELELTRGEEITEITKQTTNADEFDTAVASKLPVGTKVYEINEKGDIYIALVDGKEIRYLGLREG